jgi:glycosyltransferase involved in cell wall biosynthesis
MHIVHILNGKANPETLNGVNKIVHWMATGETSQGHNVEVWGITATVSKPRTDVYNYRLRLFQPTRSRVAITREMKNSLAKLDQSTWVHFHSVFIPEFPGIAQMLRDRGIPYGLTPHGGYSPGVLRKNKLIKKLYIALREKQYVAGASMVQATGQKEVNDILAIASHVKVVLIPNGQELNLLAGIEVPQMLSEHPIIGYCGRMAIQQKGLDYLINGFSTYKKNGGKGTLWMIGDGSDKATVEHMVAKMNIQKAVKFFGAMSGVAKLKALDNCDAFIHTSRWEGLPMSCLEAAALGKPLLVSRETNLAEYIAESKAGLVLDETSAEGVTRVLARVQTLYSDKRLQQAGKNARNLIEKRFGWEENARSFVAAAASARNAVE